MLSPDGKRFVYMAGTWTATRLMVADLDGSDAKLINDGFFESLEQPLVA